MAEERYLSNAPIKEGLIDIHVRKRADFNVDALATAVARLEPEYYKKGALVEGEVKVELSPQDASATLTRSGEIGLRFHSRDEKYVAQFRLESFTLSRLAPYEKWDNLAAEARRLWSIYLECAAPESVTRVATRFINNLQLPMQPGECFENYLTASPQVPAGLPQTLSAFLQRVVIYNSELNAIANLTQVLEAGAMTDRVPVILDIDAYHQAEFDPHGTEMWDCLAQLREFKNKAFFESLTEKAIKLYL
ncbi:MAG: TIGR04255 family protein [Gammaproteobacteria bacterium]